MPIIFLFLSWPGYSQDSIRTTTDVYIARGIVIDGDTIWISEIDEVFIFPEKNFRNFWQRMRYSRLVINVQRAYPWAKLAAGIMEEVNAQLLFLETEEEEKAYLKQVEKELLDSYTEDLKRLTITQGKILIKLVYRETGTTSYDLVEFYRGKFSAFFWQALARLFGSNLKIQYDPYGEDRLIEEIVVLIENGQI